MGYDTIYIYMELNSNKCLWKCYNGIDLALAPEPSSSSTPPRQQRARGPRPHMTYACMYVLRREHFVIPVSDVRARVRHLHVKRVVGENPSPGLDGIIYLFAAPLPPSPIMPHTNTLPHKSTVDALAGQVSVVLKHTLTHTAPDLTLNRSSSYLIGLNSHHRCWVCLCVCT